MEVLKVEKLNVVLGGKRVLEDVSFSLKRGEILAILGPNGAGKSTLLKAIAGIVPYKGSIFISKGVKVGYVPQNINFNPRIPLTVEDFVFLGTGKDRRKLEGILKKLSIEKYRKELYSKLSLGNKQRVVIAKAMYHGSNLLLLDEPTSNLDMEVQIRFYKLLSELKHQGISIILVSHDVGIVVSYVDRVLCLNRKMFYHGKPERALNLELLRKVYGSNVGIVIHDH